MNTQQAASAAQKFIDSALEWLGEFLPHLIGAIFIIIIGMWLAGVVANFVSKTMKGAKVSTEVVTFVHSFVKIGLRIIVIIAAVAKLGFNIASLVTALGAATVAIGLALQDTLKNVASGMMVLVNKPFKVGDYISVSGFEGTVTKIDISSTHLLTIDNKEVIIPNSNITVNNITNYSSQESRLIDLRYNVAYGSDMEKVRSVLNKIISENDKIKDTPKKPFVAIGEHCDSSVKIVVRVCVDTADYWPVYYYMQEEVLKRFAQNSIEIPFAQVDVHTK